MFKESLKMSWQNIIHNKMRSFLTILGVLIGVGSIIALISIVQGVTTDLTSQVMDMGADTVSVRAMGTPLKKGLVATDLKKISEVENVSAVSPTITGTASLSYKSKIMEDVVVQGKNQFYFKNTKDLIQNGRGIYSVDVEGKNRVVVIGKNVAEDLFPAENPLDKKILINSVTYTVVGTLQASSGYAAGSNDDSIIIPYTTAMSLLGSGYINSVDIYLVDSKLSDTTTSDIKTVLNTAFNFNEDGYEISNMQNILDTVATMTTTLTLMLAGIASISLIVGGIGIMNMMLVSVTERTTEIGLRKALGAKPQTIQLQFILEALFLSLLGGALGFGVGAVIAYIAALIIGTPFAIAAYSVLLAIGFSVVIGIGFGYAPARRASKLNPIDALRSA